MRFTNEEIAIICRIIDSKSSERAQAYENWANATNPHVNYICQRRYEKLREEHELLRKIINEANADHPVGESAPEFKMPF